MVDSPSWVNESTERRNVLKKIGTGLGVGTVVGSAPVSANNCTLNEDYVDGYWLTVHGEEDVYESCTVEYELFLFEENHGKNTTARLEESTNDYARIRNYDSIGGDMKALGGSLSSDDYHKFEFDYDGDKSPFSKLEARQDLTAYFRDKLYDDWNWDVEFHGCGTVHMRFSNSDYEPIPLNGTDEYFVETGTTTTESYLTVNVEHEANTGGDEAYPAAYVAGNVTRIEVTNVGGPCTSNIVQVAATSY